MYANTSTVNAVYEKVIRISNPSRKTIIKTIDQTIPQNTYDIMTYKCVRGAIVSKVEKRLKQEKAKKKMKELNSADGGQEKKWDNAAGWRAQD
jgi:hypothetical protein